MKHWHSWMHSKDGVRTIPPVKPWVWGCSSGLFPPPLSTLILFWALKWCPLGSSKEIPSQESIIDWARVRGTECVWKPKPLLLNYSLLLNRKGCTNYFIVLLTNLVLPLGWDSLSCQGQTQHCQAASVGPLIKILSNLQPWIRLHKFSLISKRLCHGREIHLLFPGNTGNDEQSLSCDLIKKLNMSELPLAWPLTLMCSLAFLL